jgi:pyranose oxidase
MTEQTMAVCQVVIKSSLVKSVRDDPRCKEHFRKFPKDPLHIPFNDPNPQVKSSQRSWYKIHIL